MASWKKFDRLPRRTLARQENQIKNRFRKQNKIKENYWACSFPEAGKKCWKSWYSSAQMRITKEQPALACYGADGFEK